MLIVMLILVLLVPSIGLAAYQNPTVISNDRIAEGYSRIGFLFSGNAGEPQVRRDFVITEDTTAVSLRNWVDATITQLDLLHTAATLPTLQPGQIISRLARTRPALTSKQIWVNKFSRYLQFKDSGIVATAAELAAMKADLEATYQAGFLAE